jgi:hemoglobin-like flavoprotein
VGQRWSLPPLQHYFHAGGEATKDVPRIFNDSYERVRHCPGRSSSEFFTTFYNLLVATSDEAASKFRNTDMAAQVRALQSSVAFLLNFFITNRQDENLIRIAERHSKRGMDVDPELYSVWLECLIETVRQFDPKFNDDLERAWRVVFSKGIEFMTSRYK